MEKRHDGPYILVILLLLGLLAVAFWSDDVPNRVGQSAGGEVGSASASGSASFPRSSSNVIGGALGTEGALGRTLNNRVRNDD